MAKASQSPSAWPDAIKTIYVLCHPVKEKNRYERLVPHLLQRGIPGDRIRFWAPTWGSELTLEQIFTAYNPYLERGIPTFSFKGPNLTRGEISLGINFATAVLDVATSGTQGLIMFLESDIWLRDDFVPRLCELLTDTEGRPWDYLSLGEGVGTRPPGASSYYAPTKAYVPPHQWVFRCTDSMLFSTEYLRRLAHTVLPFKEIIDWEMNYQLMLHRGTALWADPPLAEQGTCYSRLITTLPA
jgi:hypothetical protein